MTTDDDDSSIIDRIGCQWSRDHCGLPKAGYPGLPRLESWNVPNRIESLDNDADEFKLKTKLWAHWNNNFNWAAQN